MIDVICVVNGLQRRRSHLHTTSATSGRLISSDDLRLFRSLARSLARSSLPPSSNGTLYRAGGVACLTCPSVKDEPGEQSVCLVCADSCARCGRCCFSVTFEPPLKTLSRAQINAR